MKSKKIFFNLIGLFCLLAMFTVGCNTYQSQTQSQPSARINTGTGISMGFTEIRITTNRSDMNPVNKKAQVKKPVVHKQEVQEQGNEVAKKISYESFDDCGDPHCQKCIWERENKSPHVVRVQEGDRGMPNGESLSPIESPVKAIVPTTIELPFNQFFDLEMECGGNKGRWGYLLKDGQFTNTPVMQVNGRTGGQRAMDFVGSVSTGAGIAAGAAMIRPSRNSFSGGNATGGGSTSTASATGGAGGSSTATSSSGP